MNKVLLSSGGMDSFLLAHEPALDGAEHVFVDIGQRYIFKERAAARYVAKSAGVLLREVKTIGQAMFEHRPTGIIPFRNAELILCAAQYGQDIYLGVIADEVNSDKSLDFMNAMQDVLNISHRQQYWTEGKTYRLLTPFRDTTKTQLVERYLERGGDMNKLLRSVSCYSATDAHCGECGSCFKRWVALTCATGKDYGSHFLEHPASWHPRSYWEQKLSTYAEARREDVFKALTTAGV